MGEADSQIFAEDVVLYAMRNRDRMWKRVLWNIREDDPDVKRVFTPEIGKAVLHFAEQESWDYMDVACFLIQEILPDKRFSYGKLIYCLTAVGKEFLSWNRKETLFSYCALIAEVCCYCFDKGYKSLIESAIIAAGVSINEKLKFSTPSDRERYHRYAVEYNKVFEETFESGETNLSLKLLSDINNNLDFVQDRLSKALVTSCLR